MAVARLPDCARVCSLRVRSRVCLAPHPRRSAPRRSPQPPRGSSQWCVALRVQPAGRRHCCRAAAHCCCKPPCAARPAQVLTLRDTAGTGCPAQNASETGSDFPQVSDVTPAVCTKCFVRVAGRGGSRVEALSGGGGSRVGAVSEGGWNRAGAGAAAAHSVRWTHNLAGWAPVCVHRGVAGARVSASALLASCVRAELDCGARRKRSLCRSDRPAPPPQDWNVVTNPLASFFRQGEGARGLGGGRTTCAESVDRGRRRTSASADAAVSSASDTQGRAVQSTSRAAPPHRRVSSPDPVLTPYFGRIRELRCLHGRQLRPGEPGVRRGRQPPRAGAGSANFTASARVLCVGGARRTLPRTASPPSRAELPRAVRGLHCVHEPGS